MGKCSIPRSNPGGGAERIGDIKVTTRTSLGDKWVLCNGDPMPGAEVVIPNIADDNSWINIGGIPQTVTYKDSDHSLDVNGAIYSKDGIWYIASDVKIDTDFVDVLIFKYNQNDGSISVFCEIRNAEDLYMNSNMYPHLLYDESTNKLAVALVAHPDGWADSLTSIYLYIINSSGTIIDEFCPYGEARNLFAYTHPNEEVIGDYLIEFVNNMPTPLIFMNNKFVWLEEYLVTHLSDESGENAIHESRTYLLSLDDKYNLQDLDTSIFDIESMYERYGIDIVYSYGIFKYNTNNGIYLFASFHTDVYNLFKCIFCDKNYNFKTVIDMDDSQYATFHPSVCTTDGTTLYCQPYNETSYMPIFLINNGSIIKTLSAESNGFTKMILIQGKIYVNSNTISQWVWLDTETGSYSNNECNFSYNIVNMLNNSINNSDVQAGGFIHTSHLNGSDNYYFFDGNDQTPRLPVITVDEEAYCFMKIKE